MSNAFVILHGRLDAARTVDFARWLPITPQDEVVWQAPGGPTLLRSWSCAPELSRGGWWDVSEDEAVVFDGWFTEPPEAPLTASVAAGLRGALKRATLPERIAGDGADVLDGNFCAAHLHASGDVDVVQDILGAAHVYYGERDGLIAISNRSVLVALALHHGQLPTPSHASLGWLLTNLGAPFREVSLWEGITCLPMESHLRLRAGRLTRHDAPQDARAVRAPWDQHFADLCQRVGQIKRLPDAPCKLALTGGKDSRLVLAGLIGADALGRVNHAYLRARPEHPDVQVARQLAAHYGLRFELIPPAEASDEPFLERLDRHLFLTEGLVNAWDLKADTARAPWLMLHGNFGETLRGKLKSYFVFGWPVVWAKYTHPGFLNPFKMLQPHLVAHYRRCYIAWMRQQRAHHISALQVNERLHREVRMHRWAGETLQADNLTHLSANPIIGLALYRHYLTLPPHERKGERAHFELIRRADDWLWRQPLANDQWKPWITRTRPAPTTGDTHTTSPQLHTWRREGPALRDWLLSPGCPELHELLNPQAVATFCHTLDPHSPRAFDLKNFYILLGIRRVIEQGIVPSDRPASPPGPLSRRPGEGGA